MDHPGYPFRTSATPILSPDERAALTAGRVLDAGKEYPSALKIGRLCGFGETKARGVIVGLEIKELWPHTRVSRRSGPPPVDDEPVGDEAEGEGESNPDSVGQPGSLTLGQIAGRLALVRRAKAARVLAGLDPTIPPGEMDELFGPASDFAARERAARPMAGRVESKPTPAAPKSTRATAPRIRTPGTERPPRVYRQPVGFAAGAGKRVRDES